MSAAGPATSSQPAAVAPAATGRPQASQADSCPLCGAPLAPEQEWCLRCGAAARTRLAAAPNWKGPFTAVAIVGVLALGALAAALVALAGDTGPPPPAITHTVTSGAPAASAQPTTALPPTATAPAAPGATTTAPAQTTTAPGAATATSTTPAPAGTTGQGRGTNQPAPAKSRKLSPEAEKKLRELNLSGQIKQ